MWTGHNQALHVHCGLDQLSPLPTSVGMTTDEWVAAKHCGRTKRSRISDTHRLRWSLQFRYINNQSLLGSVTENDLVTQTVSDLWWNQTGSDLHMFITFCWWWWWLVFNNSTRDKDDTTVGVGNSRRYCNTGYDQSQGRRPSTLKCIGSISRRRYRAQPSVRNYEPQHFVEIYQYFVHFSVGWGGGKPLTPDKSSTEPTKPDSNYFIHMCIFVIVLSCTAIAWQRKINKKRFNSIQFNSIQFNSIQFNSIQFNSIQFNMAS